MVSKEDIFKHLESDIKYIEDKYGEQEQLTADQWLALIMEETGELAMAVNDGEIQNVWDEGSQVCATIIKFLQAYLNNLNMVNAKDSTIYKVVDGKVVPLG